MSCMIHVENALHNLMKKDPYLKEHLGDVRMHLERFNNQRLKLTQNSDLSHVANGSMYFGFHQTADGWVFREWLPGADAVWLYGDFNHWEKYEYPLNDIGDGVWEITLKGKNTLKSTKKQASVID